MIQGVTESPPFFFDANLRKPGEKWDVVFFPMAIVSLAEGTPNTSRQMKECLPKKGPFQIGSLSFQPLIFKKHSLFVRNDVTDEFSTVSLSNFEDIRKKSARKN